MACRRRRHRRAQPDHRRGGDGQGDRRAALAVRRRGRGPARQPGTVVNVGEPIVSFEVEGDDGIRCRGAGAAQARAEPRRLRRRPESGRPARRARSFAALRRPAGRAPVETVERSRSRPRRPGCDSRAAPAPASANARGPPRRCASSPTTSASTSTPSPAPGSAASSPATTSATSSAEGTCPRQPGTRRHPGGRSGAGRRRASGKPGRPSRACASTPPPRWSPARSPHRTSRSS